jgi:hypothetical protein
MTICGASIPQNARCVSKEEFTIRLRRWYENTTEDVIGGNAPQGRTPWLWIQIGDVECHLNADTKRLGVQRYLEMVERYGSVMEWSVRVHQNGININKVCFGPRAERIRGFYLYTSPSFSAVGTIA